jgi:alpha-mannosidase
MTIYGHRHSHHATNSIEPPLDNAPRVPRNITHSRIDNFLSGGGQFHGMGIHRRLWKLRHSGSPHVKLRVYSVPDLKVKKKKQKKKKKKESNS